MVATAVHAAEAYLLLSLPWSSRRSVRLWLVGVVGFVDWDRDHRFHD